MWYQTWTEPLLYRSQIQALTKLRIVPLINWLPQGNGTEYSLRAVNTGQFDGYIRASAHQAARWGRPILIDLAHEMNLPGYAWSEGTGANTPSEYVRTWRRVVSIFRAQGASNVRWVWAPNVDCGGQCPFAQFYPGNRWVDWVGLDGYNGARANGSPWREFQQIFEPSYKALTAMTSKPVLIAETASAEAGGSKAIWIRQMGSSLSTRFPRVRILVWFDRLKEADWRINSSSSSLAAFRRVARLPPFSEEPAA